MTVENIRSLLETKTSEEIAREFSDNLNKAIQMKAEEEAATETRIEALREIMVLIEDYLYLSGHKCPNEEEVDVREVDKMIQDFLAMTETMGNQGWLSFLRGTPSTGTNTKNIDPNAKNVTPNIEYTEDTNKNNPTIDLFVNTTNPTLGSETPDTNKNDPVIKEIPLRTTLSPWEELFISILEKNN